jgi:hypothetical protein
VTEEKLKHSIKPAKNTDSFLSLEDRQQRHKRCSQDQEVHIALDVTEDNNIE